MERKGQLQRALHGARGCQQRLNLRRRMAVLDQMAAETFRTAAYLAHYYDEGKGGERGMSTQRLSEEVGAHAPAPGDPRGG